MQAAFIRQTGPADSIEFGELPEPRPGRGQVLVQVAAVCVDPVDVLVRSGRLAESLPFPFIIGRDAAGTVVATGSGVTRFALGDRVWCNNQGYAGRQGTFAQLIAVDEKLLYPLPEGTDFQSAVAFVHSGLTACLGLARCGLRSGESILIDGAAGNVGSAVLQLARDRGAQVLATAGNNDGLGWCKSLGAKESVNYKTADIDHAVAEFSPGGVDVYWDTSGKPDFDRAVRAVRAGGRIVLMAGFDARPPFPVGAFYVKDCSMFGFAVTYASVGELAASAVEINRRLAGGSLRVRIDRVGPLSDAAAAHRLIESHAPLQGKIVLVP